jgi:ATPase subunit of ABC transporter with duplicated ATPase domains
MKHLKINITNYDIRGTQILRDVELLINESDRVALVGGNGVGKTTLMRMIAGDITEYDGSIDNL